MPTYSYRAKDNEGEIERGLVEAPSADSAADILHQRGYFIVNLSEKREFPNPLRRFTDRITQSDITDFTRQLATMIEAGLPLPKALTILAEQAQNKSFKQLLGKILANIESGMSFTDALGVHAEHFSKTYIALIRSGEASGTLDNVLLRLADNLEKQREFRGKVKGALIYPTIIFFGMGVVMFIMMAFVIPKLTDLYTEFEVELPAATRYLIRISDFFAAYWYFIIVVFAGGAYLFLRWKNTSIGSKVWDRFVLSLPLIGELQKEIILIEASRTIGILVGAGLSITETLEIVAEAVDNSVYRDGLTKAKKAVEKGRQLGDTIARNAAFPPIFAEMVSIGEETGKLDETLQRLSQFFETKSDQTVKGLTAAIEPLIMVMLGLGVGFLILAIVLPIYNLTTAIK